MSFSPELGRPHVSKDPTRGYVEYDPYVRLSDGTKFPGQHGLTDIRAEIARSAYEAKMLNIPLIQNILKK